MLIQFVLVLAVLTILYVLVRRSRAVSVQAGKRVALVLFALVNSYAVMRPDDLSAVAHLLEVWPGTDLMLYTLVVAIMAGMFSTDQRLGVVDCRDRELAPNVAIRGAEAIDREQGLWPAPTTTATANDRAPTTVGDPIR